MENVNVFCAQTKKQTDSQGKNYKLCPQSIDAEAQIFVQKIFQYKERQQ